MKNSNVTVLKLSDQQIEQVKKDLGIDNTKNVPHSILISAVANDVARELSIDAHAKIHAVAVR